MKNINIYAFADEANPNIDGQIDAMKRNALQGLEIRNVDGVNVRAKAATGTDIIGNLDAGDKVKVLDRYYSDEWIQISFEGEIGYVYAEYLTFK